ncbi:hypothetical protein B0H10DRAFT_1956875 [Mycena sp. CBHHK59/15]|nr:hypothetical protein B0H10DRAFT_1956875 [Mycena sp. CBHHK59/15]
MSNDKSGDDASATSREALVDKCNVPVMPSNRRSKPRSSAADHGHGEQESSVGVESEASWSDGEDTVQDLSEGPDANINEDGFNGSNEKFLQTVHEALNRNKRAELSMRMIEGLQVVKKPNRVKCAALDEGREILHADTCNSQMREPLMIVGWINKERTMQREVGDGGQGGWGIQNDNCSVEEGFSDVVHEYEMGYILIEIAA